VTTGKPGTGGAFGTLLRRHREAAGLTQEGLAERARLSVRGLSDLERGARRAPYAATVRRLAGALRLSAAARAELAAAGARRRPPGPAPAPTAVKMGPPDQVAGSSVTLWPSASRRPTRRRCTAARSRSSK
jgi:transcriptional regulator with XRE-family HTH domain